MSLTTVSAGVLRSAEEHTIQTVGRALQRRLTCGSAVVESQLTACLLFDLAQTVTALAAIYPLMVKRAGTLRLE